MLCVSVLVFFLYMFSVGADHGRWLIPRINNKTCHEDPCIVTHPFVYSNKSRATHLDLSRFYFLSDVTIVNPHVAFIRPPKKLLKAPLQKVVILTNITHNNAQLLRKVFLYNDQTILSFDECVVTNFIPENCHFVIGDLVIDEHFVLPGPTGYVEWLSGCLSIRNTLFTNTDMDFINGLIVGGQYCGRTSIFQRTINNSRLCAYDLFPSETWGLIRRCGIEKIILPSTHVHIYAVLASCLIGLFLHSPIIYVANARYCLYLWGKSLEKEMQKCNEYIQSSVVRKRKSTQLPGRMTETEAPQRDPLIDVMITREKAGTSRSVKCFFIVLTFNVVLLCMGFIYTANAYFFF